MINSRVFEIQFPRTYRSIMEEIHKHVSTTRLPSTQCPIVCACPSALRTGTESCTICQPASVAFESVGCEDSFADNRCPRCRRTSSSEHIVAHCSRHTSRTSACVHRRRSRRRFSSLIEYFYYCARKLPIVCDLRVVAWQTWRTFPRIHHPRRTHEIIRSARITSAYTHKIAIGIIDLVCVSVRECVCTYTFIGYTRPLSACTQHKYKHKHIAGPSAIRNGIERDRTRQ